MNDPRFCERAMEAWLGDSEHAALTGWTRRVTEALAHIADAWCVADEQNAAAAVAAIAFLLPRSRQESQIRTWRLFVESCAGGSAEHGGRGTELLAAVDEFKRMLDTVRDIHRAVKP